MGPLNFFSVAVFEAVYYKDDWTSYSRAQELISQSIALATLCQYLYIPSYFASVCLST